MAEGVADALWRHVMEGDEFARDVVGKQLARAADSVGANIAESFGRFNFGEKLQFLYYSRGSLFETKYWINRAKVRDLMSSTEAQTYAEQLTELARQLNAFASGLKSVRAEQKTHDRNIRESTAEYLAFDLDQFPDPLFTKSDLAWRNA
jgi:four helix bundle protein